MPLLQIIQHVCKRQNIPVPTTALGSGQDQVVQLIGLLEEECNDLASRHDWQALTFEAAHTTVAAEDQGAISTIAANGFRYIKNNTIWDRTRRLPVYGPMSGQNWQAVKAIAVNGPNYQFRIRGGKLLSNPAPTAGNNWRFEYVSHNFIIDPNGITYKQYFTNDDDALLLPENLLIMGLRWRYLREKGMDYAELFRIYEMQVKDAMGRDAGKPTLNMGEGRDVGPSVFIPAGSWIP